MSELYDLLNTLIGKVNASVKTEAQTLTDEQKEQARANIGAASIDDIGSSSGEIADLIVKQGGDTLTWDGNTEGLVPFDGFFYKVSNIVLTESDFENGATTLIDGQEFEPAVIQFEEDGYGMIYAGYSEEDMLALQIIPRDNYDMYGDGSVIGSAGLFANRAFSLTIPGYTGFVTEELNAKYLPSVGNIPASWIAALKTAMGI